MQGIVSQEESERYDRQIRLWGNEAQSKLQRSRVLVCGLHGLHIEVVKNLILAGLSITVLDHNNVQDKDIQSNFFITKSDLHSNIATAALPRLCGLNPYVRIEADTRLIESTPDDFFEQFQVIMLTSDTSESEIHRISELCGIRNILLFFSGAFALEGWFVSDLGKSFTYCRDTSTELLTRSYRPLTHVLSVRWADLITKHTALPLTFVKARLFALYRASIFKSSEWSPSAIDLASFEIFAKSHIEQNGLEASVLADLKLQEFLGSCNFAPMSVCSVAGALLSQAVLTAVSGKGEPTESIMVVDCRTFEARSIHLQ